MRSITLLSTAAALAGAQIADAQNVRYWDRPVSGDWDVASNWSPGDVPDTTSETAIIRAPGTYEVNLHHSTLLRSIEISGREAVLNIGAGNICHLAYLSGTALTIEGVLCVNPTAENYYTELAICADQNGVNLFGGGEIRLNANPANLDSARLGELCNTYAPLRLAETAAIVGTGKIMRRLVNYGNLIADVKERVLSVEQSVVNFGSLLAIGGGNLLLPSVISQQGGSIVVGDDASAVILRGTTVWGGAVENAQGGRCQYSEYVTLGNVTLLGMHRVESSQLSVYDSLINNGMLFIGSQSHSGSIEFRSEPTQLRGQGTVLLNHGGAIYALPEADSLTIDADQQIAGSGDIVGGVLNRGILTPGANDGATGILNIRSFGYTSKWRQAQQATLIIDALGAQTGQYDRITGDGSLTWDGMLKVRLINGFVPAVGDRFTIATHSSSEGTFANVELPPTSAGVWRVIYGRTSTALLLTCATDLDNDADTDLSDLTILLRNFASSDAEPTEGDLNADRRVDVQDLALLLGAFGQRCR